MDTATEQEQEQEQEQVAPQEELPENKGDEDEVRVGWLMVSEGEQIVIPHPEGRTKEEVVEAFFKAKCNKKNSAFRLGLGVFEPEEISTFVWSEDVQFPEMEKFDGIQERLEAVMGATAELTQNQAALQQAQAMLFQEEMEDLEEELEEKAMVEAQAVAPDPPAAKPPAAKAKKEFRPPGA